MLDDRSADEIADDDGCSVADTVIMLAAAAVVMAVVVGVAVVTAYSRMGNCVFDEWSP